jgi:hypothetical protein
MTAYAATDVSSNVGVQVAERTGAASGDTVPAGSLLLVRNTGAGSHTFTITTNNTSGGLGVEDRVWTIPAAQAFSGRVESDWGDADGLCAVAINGTPTEIKYYVLGSV